MTTYILHFDINETLILSDQSNGKSVIDGILNDLSREVYLQDKGVTFKDYSESLHPGLESEMKENRLRMLREELPSLLSPEQKERMEYCVERAKNPIAPSFTYLIDELAKRGIKYIVHLRTFGEDLLRILPHVEKVVGKMHIIDPKDYPSNESLRQIFHTQNCAMREDYLPWKNSNKHYSKGKRFPIEDSAEYKAFFFDDNVLRGIVCPYNANGSIIDPSSLIGTYLHNVSAMKAYLDDTYFLKKIQPYL